MEGANQTSAEDLKSGPEINPWGDLLKSGKIFFKGDPNFHLELKELPRSADFTIMFSERARRSTLDDVIKKNVGCEINETSNTMIVLPQDSRSPRISLEVMLLLCRRYAKRTKLLLNASKGKIGKKQLSTERVVTYTCPHII